MICRVCGKQEVESLYESPLLPLKLWPTLKTDTPKNQSVFLMLCRSCGHLQTQPVSDNEIHAMYSGDAFNCTNARQNIERKRLIEETQRKPIENLRVLEVGGGRNSFVNHLSDTNFRIVVDFKVEDDVAENVDLVINSNIESALDDEAELDQIYLFHTLEHLDNPVEVLKKLWGMLKDGGQIFIEVPDYCFDAENQPHYALFQMHISMFTQNTLTNCLAYSGFEQQNVFRHAGVLFGVFSKTANMPVKENFYKESYDFASLFMKSQNIIQNKIDAVLAEIQDNTAAIFGGGGSTNLFLYNHPDLANKIRFAVDNDPAKQGLYLFNGKIKIISKEEASRLDLQSLIVIDPSHQTYLSVSRFNVINLCSGVLL